MAILSSLAEAIAEIEGIDYASVIMIARTVREGGLIRTGGRGTSAAHMQVTDAANLLIAVNVSPRLRSAVETVKTYRDLAGEVPFDEPWVPSTMRFTFGTALESLIEVIADRTFPSEFLGCPVPESVRKAFGENELTLRLTFYKPEPVATLGIRHGQVGPGLRFYFRKVGKEKGRRHRLGDRSESVSIGLPTIQAVAELLRDH